MMWEHTTSLDIDTRDFTPLHHYCVTLLTEAINYVEEKYPSEATEGDGFASKTLAQWRDWRTHHQNVADTQTAA